MIRIRSIWPFDLCVWSDCINFYALWWFCGTRWLRNVLFCCSFRCSYGYFKYVVLKMRAFRHFKLFVLVSAFALLESAYKLLSMQCCFYLFVINLWSFNVGWSLLSIQYLDDQRWRWFVWVSCVCVYVWVGKQKIMKLELNHRSFFNW